MEIKIFNRELELIGILDNFTSLIWTRRYFQSGEFQLVAPLTKDSVNLLKRENIIYKGNGDNEAGYIETVNISLNTSGEEIMTIHGKFITNYLERRIVWGNDNVNSSSEVAMRSLVSKNAITCPSERIISNLQLGALKGYTETVKKSVSDKNLIEAVQEIAETSQLGYRNTLDYINKKILFEVYKGVDRTVNQSLIAPCIFSRDFENILEQEYTDSLNNFRNVTLVAGAGEGSTRKRTTVGFATGLDRFELFTDARDISDKKTISTPKIDEVTGEYVVDEEGNTIYEDTEVQMSDSEYIPLLKQRGNEKLAECTDIKTFDSKINTRGNNIYRVDYDLGDIVTVTDKKWGLQLDTRITEIEEIYEGGKIEINPTFGNNIPTLIDKIKRMVR